MAFYFDLLFNKKFDFLPHLNPSVSFSRSPVLYLNLALVAPVLMTGDDDGDEANHSDDHYDRDYGDENELRNGYHDVVDIDYLY